MKLGLSFMLAKLGLTQQDAINALVGMLARRVYITSYEQAEIYEDVPGELKRFLGDKTYRKMVSKVGKRVRSRVLGTNNVFDAFTGLADEHSVGLRSIRDRLEYGDGELVLDDETITAFSGDLVNSVLNYLNFGPDEEGNFSELSAPDPEAPTLTSEMMSGFRSLGQYMSKQDMYPDIGEHLTVAEGTTLWLPESVV